MRLTRLKVRNIASMKGEHIVDFADVMNHSPLFAITGETGSGKSTLLNAIGLALYGQIFKRSLIQNDVVTLGEKEGFIELIFEVKGKTFLASWRARVRKQNGEAYAILPSPTRELYSLDGNEFESPRTITQEKTEDILNLDFDQFSKCVVLNQGEFARFLMSTFTERKDILEKLYPGELLENLSRELRTELDFYLTQKNQLDIELKTLKDDGSPSVNIEEELVVSKRELTLHENWSELTDKIHFHFTSLHSYHQKNSENLRRIDLTKHELATGTTQYNLFLRSTEEAQKIREAVQKEMDERGPRLQELLKSEEALKNARTSLETFTKEEARVRSEIVEVEKKLNTLSLEEKTLIPEKEETLGKMKYPYEEVFRQRQNIEDLIDKLSQLDLLNQKADSEKKELSTLESRGKETAGKLQEIQEKLKLIPEDSTQTLNALLKKKDESQKARARDFEVSNQIKRMDMIIQETTAGIQVNREDFRKATEEREPLLATLKLQELLSAVSFCLLHPETESKGTCPVCETPFGGGKLESLRKLAAGFDSGKINARSEVLHSQIMKLEAQHNVLTKTLEDNRKSLGELNAEKKKLESFLIPEADLEKKIEEVQKHSWDREQLLPLVKSTESELEKIRSEYRDLKTKLTQKENDITQRNGDVSILTGKLTSFIPVFDKAMIPELRLDLRLSILLSELDGKITRVKNDIGHWKSRLTELTGTLKTVTDNKSASEIKVKELSTLLEAELKGESASEVLKQLSLKQKNAQEELEKKDAERRKQEQALKEFQGRLYTLDEQSRDIEVQFGKEKKELTEISLKELPVLNEKLTQIQVTMRKLGLQLDSPQELFTPLKELIESEKTLLKTATNEAHKKVAHFMAIKETHEKKKDRIQLLELKRDDVLKDLKRRERLFEILGKDELRTYVLSLVEENLIIVTNEELSRLCQGRYEIIHQTKTNKLAPEFFIMDKFRDGGIRKVSTLSGGETFMVSLAMALGLAEMTRGTAEIDTLFIDEGFGTLDQESLEDVLDVLNQIQTRGLMVGIISHVKHLTDSIPVNLVLNKKRDGTSSVSIRIH